MGRRSNGTTLSCYRRPRFTLTMATISQHHSGYNTLKSGPEPEEMVDIIKLSSLNIPVDQTGVFSNMHKQHSTGVYALGCDWVAVSNDLTKYDLRVISS